MKKFLSALLAVGIVFGGAAPTAVNPQNYVISASAAEEYTKGTYESLTYKNYGDYIEISGCNASATSVEIPSEIDGVPVTSIGYGAFHLCSGLTSINIPNSVTSIGDYAFYNCSSLTSITISNSVTSIGVRAFNGCTCLTSITIPDSVTNIGASAFSGCSSLTSIIIPDSVTSIGDYVFYYCSGLTSVTIPDSVTTIEFKAFYGCSGLTSITIENPNCEIYDSKDTITNSQGDDYNTDYFNVTIYGYENSTAQAYAEKYDCKFEVISSKTELGDVDNDGAINSSDASLVLREYALTSTGEAPTFNEDQKAAADVNGDEAVDSSDASTILAYYAYTATGGTDSLSEFMKK